LAPFYISIIVTNLALRLQDFNKLIHSFIDPNVVWLRLVGSEGLGLGLVWLGISLGLTLAF